MPKEKKAKKDKEEKKDGRGERKSSFFGFGKKKEKENDAKRPGSVEISTDNRRDSANITSSSRIGQEVYAMSDGKKEPIEVNQPHNGSFLVSIPHYEQTIIKWNKRRFVT